MVLVLIYQGKLKTISPQLMSYNSTLTQQFDYFKLKGAWGFSLYTVFRLSGQITISPDWFIARKKQSQIRTQDVKRCQINRFLLNFEEKTKGRNSLWPEPRKEGSKMNSLGMPSIPKKNGMVTSRGTWPTISQSSPEFCWSFQILSPFLCLQVWSLKQPKKEGVGLLEN